VTDISDRFEASLWRWMRDIDIGPEIDLPPVEPPTRSLDEEAKRDLSLEHEADAVAYLGIRELARSAVMQARSEVGVLQRRCESPIELPMGIALIVVAREFPNSIAVQVLDEHGIRWGDRYEPRHAGLDLVLRIEPQAQLGEHRVDFFLTLEGAFRPLGEQPRFGTQRMVLECDGHDFHERTPDQAKRDRARDRLLQSFGFLVYRYTGREIWEDVFACAEQAIDSLSAPLRALVPPLQ
jgi:very-short-patch-repair endonuclease